MMAKLARSVLCALLSAAAPAAADEYDAIIEQTLARAAAVREARLAAYDRTDFDHAANGHTPIPANQTPASQVFTGKGYQLIAAGLSVQFHGKNASALRKAAELVTNMTMLDHGDCDDRQQ